LEKIVINGGSRLEGTIDISGAKNAAVAILPAVIVSDEPCIFENVPKIMDIELITRILSEIGAKVKLIDDHTVEIDPSTINTHVVPQDLSRHMRASYYFLGALLSKYNKATVSLPGGCNLGARPIDQHLKAFSALGCDVFVEYGMINVSCSDKMRGAHIFFDTVSVGATINSMLAAVKAEGQTVLENVAKEPHIVDIANFLNSMGADIRGAGTDVIKVRGVSRLRGATYSIIPDQIEAGTYMAAAAATGGDVLINNVIPKHLESISSRLRRAGAEVIEYDEAVRVKRTGPVMSTNIKTAPHPGFPTDMQPQMAVLLSMGQGTSIITEGIWDNRFKYVDELRRMGARIQVDGRVAVVDKINGFAGAQVRATDLRAGAALIIAGLVADGVTEIEDIHHIDRGYEDIVEKLKSLGADIKRVGAQNVVIRRAL
jgi:UDP-N-acetylglucosamine 1-carboxyvinyltransferase